MPSYDPATMLLQVGVLLAVAFLLGRLAERVGLPATTGELAAGLLLGPSLLGAVAGARALSWPFAPDQIQGLRGIALFCGVLLVGVAGATVDLTFVRGRVRTVWLISLGALGLPLVSTLAVAHLADPRLRGGRAGVWSFAAFAALALSVSAVPVIVKIFADLGVLHRNLSQLSLSVAVIDDATVWVGLSVIAALAHLRSSGDLSAIVGNLSFALTAGAALVVIAVVARRPVRVRGPAGSPDETGTGAACLMAAAFITLGAVLSNSVGLDSTLGAFVCGTIVASGRLVPVHRLRPLRTVVLGLLAPLFLAVNGLSADLTALRDPGLALAALITLLLAVA
ncbi:MAG: sodium/hydrogen exchanger, partial [Friedmanniella sp.]|nr:sodium/hydrogen exchanger [Friedmanniella sp.]